MTQNKKAIPTTESSPANTPKSVNIPRKNKRGFLWIFLASAWLPLSEATTTELGAKAKSMDGFFAYCTSNLDTTGECTNEEDGRKFSCLLVPGQIISCPTNTSRSMECVWISGITANQAQFWCDSEDEAALYGSALESPLPQTFENEIPDRLDDRNNPSPPEGRIFKNSF